MIDEQADFILSKRLPSGALLAPNDTTITPYFVSWGLMGLAQVSDPQIPATLANYLQWYLDHLNTAEQDPYGIPGTVFVYDYDPATGAESSTDAHSSVDAGVSTPIMLAHASRGVSADLRALVLDNIEQWELMMQANLTAPPHGVLDEGLCMARPEGVKYVQDNSVVYRGLHCLADLEEELGRHRPATSYRAAARRLRAQMCTILWNPTRQNWNWGMLGSKPSESDLTRGFYPYAWCQYWQVYLGVVTPDDPRAQVTWNAHCEAYPQWMDNEIDNDFPHSEMAYSAALMGDGADVLRFFDALRERYGTGWRDNWYVGEAGHVLRAAAALRDSVA
ncbi:hypothetical protein [Parenemella sanctibonifatiensis]|uniref:Uncharacterized protein n=1 Tax=Parenemella sanctibonifatiensis TaxID=2016505 RepID=A0A255E9R7_9ACTN|nr:hypothetical protein [Parenemella sanctibonifatiensis]OYN88314.1 hypothetical protein CGZ92_05110 [Parenemella sanctibonifatiensis]